MASLSDEITLEERAAMELHTEILPGTEVMQDFGEVHLVHDKSDHV